MESTPSFSLSLSLSEGRYGTASSFGVSYTEKCVSDHKRTVGNFPSFTPPQNRPTSLKSYQFYFQLSLKSNGLFTRRENYPPLKTVFPRPRIGNMMVQPSLSRNLQVYFLNKSWALKI